MIGHEEMNCSNGHYMEDSRSNNVWRNSNQSILRNHFEGSTQKQGKEPVKRNEIQVEGSEKQSTLQRKPGPYIARAEQLTNYHR